MPNIIQVRNMNYSVRRMILPIETPDIYVCLGDVPGLGPWAGVGYHPNSARTNMMRCAYNRGHGCLSEYAPYLVTSVHFQEVRNVRLYRIAADNWKYDAILRYLEANARIPNYSSWYAN